MLFSKDAWPGLEDGAITLTFRRWRRPQAVAGHRYRTAVGILEVESVAVVDPAAITDGEARAAGAASAGAVRARLRGDAALPVYRVAFHRVAEPDPRAVLAADDALTAQDIEAIARSLARMERAAGPWTAAALDAIAAQPGVRAADVAAQAGMEAAPFKRNVRRLKELGLTESLRTGYRLSPRGARYRALREGPLRPVRRPGTWWWTSVAGLPPGVHPVVTVAEDEGMAIVVPAGEAAGLEATFPSAWITLTAATALDDVGITAVFSAALAARGIACNVVAAVHHDHLFVPLDRADEALEVLRGWRP